MAYKIRKRERFDSRPPINHAQRWTEYQVVVGNKVVHRAHTRSEAERVAAEEYGSDNATA
jgi:hypothetical protein